MVKKLKNLDRDLIGILGSPGTTLGRLMKEKQWVPVLVLILVLSALLVYIIYPVQMSRLVEAAEASGQYSPEQLLYLQNTSGFARVLVPLATAFFIFLNLVIGAFFVYLFFGIAGSDGQYANFFALVVNASIIDTLVPQFLDAVSLLLNFNLSAVLSLSFWLPASTSGGFLSLLLGQVNLFSIWYIVALASGVSFFSGMKFGKCLRVAIFYLLFKALVGASFGYLALKVSGA